jgi:hypothetical protein
MKLSVLLVIAFMVVLVTVDAHDDKRMLRTGQRSGNAPAKPDPALDDKKAQEQKRKRLLNPPVSGQQINTDPKASSRFEKDLRDPVEVM